MKHQKTTQALAEKTGYIALGLAAVVASTAARAENAPSDNWLDKMISPVANPIYFEDPRIYSEVHPIFIEHWLPKNFDFSGGSVPLGGDVHVYAAQIRVKLTDRLAL